MLALRGLCFEPEKRPEANNLGDRKMRRHSKCNTVVLFRMLEHHGIQTFDRILSV